MQAAITSLMALAGAVGVGVSLFIPPDFAWSGWNTFATCVETVRYASDAWTRLIWFGFAACVLYPPVWAASAAVAAAWHRSSRIMVWPPAGATALGSVLIGSLGVTLLARHETWPALPLQWVAALAPVVHVLVLWIVLLRATPARRFAAAVLTGGIPFVLLYLALAADSARYGTPLAGYAAALISTLVLLAAAVLAGPPATARQARRLRL